MSPKYKFNKELLTFEEKDTGFFRIFKIIVAQLIAIFLFGLLVFIVLASFVKSPEYKRTAMQNKRLKEEYSILLKKYGIIKKNLKILQKQDELIYEALFQMKPPETNLVNYWAEIEDLGQAEFQRITREKLQKVLKRIKSDNKEFENLLLSINDNPEKLRNIPAILPVSFEFVKNGIFGFNYKIDPFYKTVKRHYGIDFLAPEGTPVFATADGVVISSISMSKRRINAQYGINVRIDHGNGFTTLYAHLSRKLVSAGQKVKRGQVIGYVGQTGKSFTPHLHYEVIYKDKRLDPLYFFFGSVPYIVFEKLYQENKTRGISLD